MIESSETFNTRLCLERKMRMPFIEWDLQIIILKLPNWLKNVFSNHTGIVQKNSNLYMKKSQVFDLDKF